MTWRQYETGPPPWKDQVVRKARTALAKYSSGNRMNDLNEAEACIEQLHEWEAQGRPERDSRVDVH